jgi:hypothetical protein
MQTQGWAGNSMKVSPRAGLLKKLVLNKILKNKLNKIPKYLLKYIFKKLL